MAVSTALLVGCGLLVRTYVNAEDVDPGIETASVLAAALDWSHVESTAAGGRGLIEDLRARLSRLPGVSGTSLTSHMPLSPGGADARIWIDDAAARPEAALHAAGSESVTAEHFRLLGIPIVHGRSFHATEPERSLVAVVNETLARRLWPDGAPLGRRFRLGGPSGESLEVVGVAADVKYRSLTEPARPVFYRPFSQAYSPQMTVLVQVDGHPASVQEAVRREIRSAHRDLPIWSLRTLDEQRHRAVAFRRQAAVALSILCGLGLLLSSLGLYGVVSYGVRGRAREFAIRLALGARAADVHRMVLADGLRMILPGLGLGVGLSLVLAGALRSLLFGVSDRDPLTFLVVSAVLVGVSIGALYLPARSATAMHPAATLRSE
jgi:predicted permease